MFLSLLQGLWDSTIYTRSEARIPGSTSLPATNCVTVAVMLSLFSWTMKDDDNNLWELRDLLHHVVGMFSQTFFFYILTSPKIITNVILTTVPQFNW